MRFLEVVVALAIKESEQKSSKLTFREGRKINSRELLHHGRRAGKEEKSEIRVVSGETNLILHVETYQL